MAQPVRIRVSEKGRVVIPASIRQALGIRTGDELEARVENNEMRISTLSNRIREARRFVRKFVAADRLLSEELIAERRDAARRE
jgi:AbrB family looped-hinge helix DNA binding protein